MDKKEEIILSAIHFFSKKGFYSTSVQEIAEYCGISKATLYNFFDSKESLLIEVIDFSSNRLIQNTSVVDYDDSLTPKEKLVKKITIQFDVMVENKNFVRLMFKTFVPQNNPNTSHLDHKISVLLADWYKNALYEAFGSKVEPYLWDYTFILQGIVKEYIFLSFKDETNVDFKEAVEFIVNQIEILVNHQGDKQPVLTSEKMQSYEVSESGRKVDPEIQMNQLIDEMKVKLNHVPISKASYAETLSVIQYLHEETKQEEPKVFMIKSLLSYLDDIEPLEYHVRRIRMMLKTTGIL